MERIIGVLISGFATKLYAAGLALWAASYAMDAFSEAVGAVSATLATLP